MKTTEREYIIHTLKISKGINNDVIKKITFISNEIDFAVMIDGLNRINLLWYLMYFETKGL